MWIKLESGLRINTDDVADYPADDAGTGKQVAVFKGADRGPAYVTAADVAVLDRAVGLEQITPETRRGDRFKVSPYHGVLLLIDTRTETSLTHVIQGQTALDCNIHWLCDRLNGKPEET